MKENNIVSETVKKYRPHSRKNVYAFGENLLNRNFKVSVINTVWVTDITYIFIPGYGFAYLATVIDLATRKPIGWHFSKRMTSKTAIQAVKNALIAQNYPQDVILHSDRGSQYTSKKFRDFIKLMNLKQSFSNKGCPYDNAVIESFHSSLKKELIYRVNLLSFEHARLLLFDYIDYFYTRYRLHSYLGYITPQEMEDRLKKAKTNAA